MFFMHFVCQLSYQKVAYKASKRAPHRALLDMKVLYQQAIYNETLNKKSTISMQSS